MVLVASGQQYNIGEKPTVIMYGQAYSKSMDQPGKATNAARGQLNRKK